MNVLVPGLEELPERDEGLTCGRNSLRFESGLTFPLQGAVLWRPLPAPPWRRGGLPRVHRIFPKESAALTEWLEAGAKGKAPDGAERLIGLGSGLTPAGDDLIGGATIALRAIGKNAMADRLGRWALGLAKRRTSLISRAHLECAASGEGHEALHLALNALLAGKRNFAAEIAALKKIGHTSGMDALAGALLVLRTSAPP